MWYIGYSKINYFSTWSWVLLADRSSISTFPFTRLQNCHVRVSNSFYPCFDTNEWCQKKCLLSADSNPRPFSYEPSALSLDHGSSPQERFISEDRPKLNRTLPKVSTASVLLKVCHFCKNCFLENRNKGCNSPKDYESTSFFLSPLLMQKSGL